MKAKKTNIFISIEAFCKISAKGTVVLSRDISKKMNLIIKNLSEQEKAGGVCLTLFSTTQNNIETVSDDEIVFLIFQKLVGYHETLKSKLERCCDFFGWSCVTELSCLDYACPELPNVYVEINDCNDNRVTTSEVSSLGDITSEPSEQGHSSSDEETTRPQNPLATSCNQQALFASSTKKRVELTTTFNLDGASEAIKSSADSLNPLDVIAVFVENRPHFGK